MIFDSVFNNEIFHNEIYEIACSKDMEEAYQKAKSYSDKFGSSMLVGLALMQCQLNLNSRKKDDN